MAILSTLTKLDSARFQTPEIFKKLLSASRSLANLKAVARSIPNQAILINMLSMQEAKDSSAIENIITTHDELFKESTFPEILNNPAAKEVVRYRQGLYLGFEQVLKNKLLTLNIIRSIQSEIVSNTAGFRKQPGTTLKNNNKEVIYTPPQDPKEIIYLMNELEKFMNDPTIFDADPLIKMALIHYQFEKIHPFYDGNGRTGRIINVLYLVKEELLDVPILYLSRYIMENRKKYYNLLDTVEKEDSWEEWIFYMLAAVQETAEMSKLAIEGIYSAFLHIENIVRENYKFYSKDLINSLFKHPYTKIEFLMQDLNISRITATKYLDALSEEQVLNGKTVLEKHKLGRRNYYINKMLNDLLLIARKYLN